MYTYENNSMEMYPAYEADLRFKDIGEIVMNAGHALAKGVLHSSIKYEPPFGVKISTPIFDIGLRAEVKLHKKQLCRIVKQSV